MAAWKQFEQELCRELRKIGFDAKRNWSNQFINKDGADILATDGETEFVLQLKYGLVPNLRNAQKEAESAKTGKNQIALGVSRWKGTRDTMVTLKWNDFIGLLKEK